MTAVTRRSQPVDAPLEALRETYLAAGWTPDPVNSAILYRSHHGERSVEERVTLVTAYRVDYLAQEAGWFCLCWVDHLAAPQTLQPVPYYVARGK